MGVVVGMCPPESSADDELWLMLPPVVARAVSEVAGPGSPAVFDGINIETAVLESRAAAVQARLGMDLVAALTDAGLTVPQARTVVTAA
jgi:hypothetical protein